MTVVVRVAAPGDGQVLASVLAAAGTRLTGMSSLVPDPALISARVERSVASMSKPVSTPGPEEYLFVAEACDLAAGPGAAAGPLGDGDVLGMSGIIAGVGLTETFYSYRVGLVVKSSRELDVYTQVPTIYLNSDLTGSSELCSLYVAPHGRASGMGRLLSSARLLFIAEHRERFAERTIAEMRGLVSADGTSPFWQGLGRHFFSMEFADADGIYARGNRTFLAELMPAQPIYLPLLPAETQAAVGQVHERTAPARAMLEAQGMRHEGYIDIFDGGPTIAAPTDDLYTVANSRRLRVRVADEVEGGEPWLVSSASLADFRCVLVPALVTDEVTVSAATAKALRIDQASMVRVAPGRPLQVVQRSDRLGHEVIVDDSAN